MTDDRTPLGRAVETAREAQNLSVREAAARAGFSEGRWRQIVKGYQSSGGHQVPANPRARTVKAMARAVGLDQNKALVLAGFAPEDQDHVQGADHDAGFVSTEGSTGGTDDPFRDVARLARELADAVERLPRGPGPEPVEGDR